MTEHEFFEMLNNIDDKLVVNAKPAVDTSYNPFSDMPMKIKPVCSSFWKPFAAVAACLAVVAVGLTVFLNIRGKQGEQPLSSGTVSDSASTLDPAMTLDGVKNGYPKNALYQYTGDYSELKYCSGGLLDFFIRGDLDIVAISADLIVVGTFVDDAYQTCDPAKPLEDINSSQVYSYNKLRIDKVLKGGVEVGDEIIVRNHYVVADGVYCHSGLTPMLKGDTWCYILERDYESDDNCYSASFLDRYPVPDSVQPEFPFVKNNCGLIEDQNYGDSYVRGYFDKYYDYVKRMFNGDPEILKLLRFEYNGVTYNIEQYNELPISDGSILRIIIGMPRTEIKPGDDVEVLAVIENIGDQPTALLGGINSKVNVKHSQGSYELLDVNTGTDHPLMEIAHKIQPGETCYQLMKFSTYKQLYKPEDTVIPDYVPTGKYDGTAAISFFADPNDPSGKAITKKYDAPAAILNDLSGEAITLNFTFDVNVIDNCYDVAEFTMDEFPGVIFKCDGLIVEAIDNGKSEAIMYIGLPIKNLYLIDLNGDGKREICSTISMSGALSAECIEVLDYANGKLYELSDKGNYDYRIIFDSFSGEWNVMAGKYDYTTKHEISKVPLTLDIMTEVKLSSQGVNAIATIRSAKLAGSVSECEYCEFYMVEFSGVKFVCKDKVIYADDIALEYKDIGFSGGYPVQHNFEALYLADLNGDNKREILAVCRDEDIDRTFVYIFDYANSQSYNIGLNCNDDYSLELDGDDIYLVTNGRRDEEILKLATSGMMIIRDENTDIKSFRIPEISWSEFIIDDENSSIMLKRENGETEIAVSFNGNPLTKVYLCDLNGDGRREIAAEGLSGSSSYIQVYDVTTSRNYEYTSKKCTLEMGSKPAITIYRDDGSVRFSGELTFDIMRLKVNSGKMKYWSFPEAKTVYDDNVRTDRFTVPEYDGYEFVIEGGDIAVYENGVKTMNLFGSEEVKKVCLYDTECDEEEEIYAVVKRNGESKYVICVVYKDRSGAIRTSFTESVNKYYDMDLTVNDSGTLLYKDAALG